MLRNFANIIPPGSLRYDGFVSERCQSIAAFMAQQATRFGFRCKQAARLGRRVAQVALAQSDPARFWQTLRSHGLVAPDAPLPQHDA